MKAWGASQVERQATPWKLVFWKQWLVCLAVRSALSLPDGTQDTQLEGKSEKMKPRCGLMEMGLKSQL